MKPKRFSGEKLLNRRPCDKCNGYPEFDPDRSYRCAICNQHCLKKG